MLQNHPEQKLQGETCTLMYSVSFVTDVCCKLMFRSDTRLFSGQTLKRFLVRQRSTGSCPRETTFPWTRPGRSAHSFSSHFPFLPFYFLPDLLFAANFKLLCASSVSYTPRGVCRRLIRQMFFPKRHTLPLCHIRLSAPNTAKGLEISK